MTCSKCGAALEADSAFCEACGASVQAMKPSAAGIPAAPLAQTATVPERATKACPFCGEQVLQVAIKCRFCGANLAPGAIQPQAASGITLNAPAAAAVPAAGGYAPGPSIVIQNVQATQAPAAPLPGRYKSPGVALLLSFIFPGGGQFYNGHPGKGILVLLTFWTGLAYIWSLFDAYSSAQRINRVGF